MHTAHFVHTREGSTMCGIYHMLIGELEAHRNISMLSVLGFWELKGTQVSM